MAILEQLRNEFAVWCSRGCGESRLDQALRLLTAAIVTLFPSTCLLVNRSDSASLIFLGAIGLLVWVRNGFNSSFSRRDWLFATVFVGFFASAVVAFQFGVTTDEGFRLLGRYIRFLFVLPVLLALRRYPPPAPAIWGGLGLGALVLGLDAVWESVSASGFLRPDGDTNVAILFGDIATITTFLFAAGYLYVDSRLSRVGPILVATGVLMGLMATFLSGTRGAWIAVPMLAFLFLLCRHLLKPRIILMGGLFVATISGALLLSPRSQMLQRLENINLQARAYWIVSHTDTHWVGATQCLDDPRILQAWISNSSEDYPDGWTVGVESVRSEAAKTLLANGCSHSVVVHMHNGSKQTGWAQLRHYEFPGQPVVSTHMLVKGDSSVIFGSGGSIVNVTSRSFIPLTMQAEPHTGYALYVGMRPGHDLWLLPFESRFGEYRYAVLQNPIGQRFAMWSAALHLFEKAPLIGVGTGNYEVETATLVKSGVVTPGAAHFDHPHSDYFDALSSRGLLGFLVLVLLLGVPAWLCKHGLDSHDPHRVGAALGGVLVATGFAIFGLTETMFIHSVTIGWYVIMTAVFYVCAEAQDGREN